MQITSHFLAASLDRRLFVDLFVELREYLRKNSAESCVEFQNPLSFHITLYYFPLDISNELSIENSIKNLRDNFKNIKINIDRVGVFEKNNQEYLYYLYPSEFQQLEKINKKYRLNYPNNVPDNKHPFVPHATLFKIINNKLFLKYKNPLLKIIYNHLSIQSKNNSFYDFNLYAVNSRFSPQIQVSLV